MGDGGAGATVLTLLVALAGGLLLASCAAPIPTLADFDHFDDQYSQIIARDMEKLQEDLDDGLISQTQYEVGLQKLEDQRYEKVNDLVRHNHELNESYVKNLGIPVAGYNPAPPAAGRGQSGFGSRGGGLSGPQVGRSGGALSLIHI